MKKKVSPIQAEAERLMKLLTTEYQKPSDLGGTPRLRQKALQSLVKQGKAEWQEGQTDRHFVSHRLPKEYRLKTKCEDE